MTHPDFARVSCGALSANDVDKNVELTGWVHRRRDHGGLIFIDLRDRDGITQITFDPADAATFKTAETLRSEFVVRVHGRVRLRPEGTVNPKLATGAIEVPVQTLEILNKAETPPFVVSSDDDVDENVRLKYRYLDLRRPRMQNNLTVRHRIIKTMRDYFDDARVPRDRNADPDQVDARRRARLFGAEPHLSRHVLRAAAVTADPQAIADDRRNRPLHADRALLPRRRPARRPSAGVHPNRRRDVVRRRSRRDGDDGRLRARRMGARARKADRGRDPAVHLPRSDAPLRLATSPTCASVSSSSTWRSSSGAATSRSSTRSRRRRATASSRCAIPGGASLSRREFDALTETAKSFGAKGLAYITLAADGAKGPIVKFLGDATIAALRAETLAENGDAILFVGERAKEASDIAGKLRLEIGDRLGLRDPAIFKFCWVRGFPLFELDGQRRDHVLAPSVHLAGTRPAGALRLRTAGGNGAALRPRAQRLRTRQRVDS